MGMETRMVGRASVAVAVAVAVDHASFVGGLSLAGMTRFLLPLLVVACNWRSLCNTVSALVQVPTVLLI